MRLADLEPEWFTGADGIRRVLYFDCPCGCKARLGITLKPKNPNGWDYNGAEFDAVTATPSIVHSTPGGCGWHGWLTNGEFKRC
jgi:hypothetical protein